jgi:pilus assembly protein CpaE
VRNEPAEEDEPPFDPPPLEDLLGEAEAAANEDIEEETVWAEAPPTVPAEDDVPFDPPTEEDEIFQSFQLDIPVEPAPETKPEAKPRPPRVDAPLPAITIHVSYDRPDMASVVEALRADPRAHYATLTATHGGIDAAIARFRAAPSPDLIVLDTNLRQDNIVDGVDRLRAVLAPHTRLVVLGEVNDIGLLRDLAARRVSDYIVAPAGLDALAASLCAIYAECDTARTIAVLGARGGLGASTVARNLAWTIAERHAAPAALVDLDLSFGTALSSAENPKHSIADAIAAADDIDQILQRICVERTPRLRVFAAPAKVEHGLDLEAKLDQVLARVRRTSAFVVLDLPHTWDSWVRRTLLHADEVVIVAGPDLASLRNTDGMLKFLRAGRVKTTPPTVVISMAGVPIRPEIPL